LRNIDYHTIEAAKNMGEKASGIFLKVVVPSLKPTFFAVTIMIFITGLSAMAAPLMVGGPDFQTINPMIIDFSKTQGSRDIAALLSVILGVATIIMLMVLTKIEKGKNYMSVSKTMTKLKKQKIENPILNVVAHVAAYGLFLVYSIPVILIILFSFSDSSAILSGTLSFSSLTVQNYIAMFTRPGAASPFVVSFIFSLFAAVIVAAVAIILAKITHKSKRKSDSMFSYGALIPWLLPSTFIALGLMITYGSPRLIMGNVVLVGTLFILLLGYIILRLPFSFRMIKSTFFGVNDELEEAAKSMGSGTVRTMVLVILPIILPAVFSVIVMNFNALLLDYDLTVFLYHPIFEPLGVAIKAASEETATANSQAMSFVYTVIVMVISSLALYLTMGKGIEKIKHLAGRA